MILCKCGRVFTHTDDATDHLSVVTVFNDESKHGIEYQDGFSPIGANAINAIMFANFQFLKHYMKFMPMPEPMQKGGDECGTKDSMGIPKPLSLRNDTQEDTQLVMSSQKRITNHRSNE